MITRQILYYTGEYSDRHITIGKRVHQAIKDLWNNSFKITAIAMVRELYDLSLIDAQELCEFIVNHEFQGD